MTDTDERQVSWVPSLIFGAGILLATALGVYATETQILGLCAAAVYSTSLGLAGSMDRRMGPAFTVPNWSLRKYRWFTTAALLVAALMAPAWVAGLVLGFGVEGITQLRHSPRCATNQLRKLWRKLRP